VNWQAGAEFFRQRSAREPGNDAHKFTSAQQLNLLPGFMSEPGGDVIVFFTTSSDEFLAINEELHYGPFSTQGQAAEAIAEICRELGKRFIVRLHPNLRGAHKSWWREWNLDSLNRLGAFIVRPEDQIDSYALMRNAAAVITTMSTIGVEAAYAGIPSISLGRSFGSALGATVEANTIDDLRSFIACPTHSKDQVDAALKYGSYSLTRGESVPEFFLGSGEADSRIDGKFVDPTRAFYKALTGIDLIHPY
jgi:hypothetical protein